MYITLNNFSPVIISCLVYMLYDDKLYMLKSINKVSVLFCANKIKDLPVFERYQLPIKELYLCRQECYAYLTLKNK